MDEEIYFWFFACDHGWLRIPKLLHPPLSAPIKQDESYTSTPRPQSRQLKKLPKHDTLPNKDKPVKHDVPQRWAVQIGSCRSLAQIQPTIDALKSHGYSVVVILWLLIMVNYTASRLVTRFRSAAKQLSSELNTLSTSWFCIKIR